VIRLRRQRHHLLQVDAVNEQTRSTAVRHSLLVTSEQLTVLLDPLLSATARFPRESTTGLPTRELTIDLPITFTTVVRWIAT